MPRYVKASQTSETDSLRIRSWTLTLFSLLSTGCLARLGSYGRDEIDPKALIGPLLLVTFSAGVLDITTYVNFGTFASNQTG
jgi:UTP:GlnB (protein PII) uridylyltransferase